MKLNRRALIAGSAASASMLLAPVRALAQIGPAATRTRRNIAGMRPDDPDLMAFRDGIAAMRRRRDFLSWDNQRAIHSRFDRQHGGWRFFPWHRCQLAALELIIAELTGKADFALPYWDYQDTPRLPRWLFDDPGFAFTNRAATPNTDFAALRWGNEDRFARVFQDSFDRFVGTPNTAGSVEAFGHNRIHGIMGGDMGSVGGATLDPVFWLHHANIDRVWATWHQRAGARYPRQFEAEQIEAFVYPGGRLWPISAGQTLETTGFDYSYDQLYQFAQYSMAGPTGPVGSETRQLSSRNTGSTEASVELPADWLKQMRTDPGTQTNISGAGEVRMGLSNLAGNVVRLMAQAVGSGLPPVTLLASYAFVHESHGSGPGHPSDWGTGFSFEYDIAKLILDSRGPVVLTAFTTATDDRRPAAQPNVEAFTLDLKLTSSR